MFLSRLRYYIASIPTLLMGVKNWPTLVAVWFGFPVHKPFTVELRSGCRFRVRTLLDVWILKETCLERQYERASLKIGDGWTVIDVGAGLGDFAITAATEYPRSVIYAYEPFPETFALLKENLQLNQVANVRPSARAVGAQTGLVQLHHAASEAASCTTVPVRGPGDATQVPCVTLDRLFADLGLQRCDYLKLDCEGAEYEILFHAHSSTLQKIKHICLEYHDWVTPFSHHDLERFLDGSGFSVRRTPNPVHRHLGFLHAENRGHWELP